MTVLLVSEAFAVRLVTFYDVPRLGIGIVFLENVLVHFHCSAVVSVNSKHFVVPYNQVEGQYVA